MAGRHYSAQELEMIATMRHRGLSIPAVAARLGRTPNGVQGALRARRWVDPMLSRTMRSVRIFSSPEQRAFREFVRSRAAGRTPSDIRDQWNIKAATNGWPTVNNERVTYYLRQLGLQKTAREYMQFESYRRRQRIAQRARCAIEREASVRALKARRVEQFAHTSDLPRRTCQVCRETWPLTEEFFCQAGSSPKYFLNACRICSHRITGTAAERRRQRMLMYDRNVVVHQISVAKAERDVFLHEHGNFPTLKCSHCHEDWELLSKRFPKYKLASGGERYRKTCRFCLRTSARLKQRAKKEPEWSRVSYPRGSVSRIVGVARASV